MTNVLIITSLACQFIFWLFNSSESIIFDLAQIIKAKIPNVYLKPLFDCLACMSSFWGLVAFYYFQLDAKILIPFIFSLGGLNIILGSIWNR